MAWYIVCIFVGIVIGLIIADAMEKPTTSVSYKGKVRQKGQNNTILIKKETEPTLDTKKEIRKQKRAERRQKRKNKRAID